MNTDVRTTTKKIYKHAGKCDDQQNIKDIVDSSMVSTPEVVRDNSTNTPITSTPVKKPSARKSLSLFTNILDVKPKTEKRRVVAENLNAEPLKLVIACGSII